LNFYADLEILRTIKTITIAWNLADWRGGFPSDGYLHLNDINHPAKHTPNSLKNQAIVWIFFEKHLIKTHPCLHTDFHTPSREGNIYMIFMFSIRLVKSFSI